MCMEMCDLSVSHNSQRRRDKTSRTSVATRTDLHSVGTPAGSLGLEEVERIWETAVKVGTERQAGRRWIWQAGCCHPSPPFPPPLKQPRAPDRCEEGSKPWLWTRDRAHAAVQTGDLLGRVIWEDLRQKGAGGQREPAVCLCLHVQRSSGPVKPDNKHPSPHAVVRYGHKDMCYDYCYLPGQL